MSAKAGKRPLRSLTAHEKLDAIRRVHDGESKASVARDIGVPESTLRGWCKNEDKISYLSRQSSPETDESLEHNHQSKRSKVDDPNLQPYNLSLKTNGSASAYSPNSETRYPSHALDYTKNDAENAKTPLNLNTKTETPKTSNNTSERERNRAELARLSIELGLNRPEIFLAGLNNPTQSLAEISANIALFTQWNNLLTQQQRLPPSNKSKITAPADTSTQMISPPTGLLTTVDSQKHLGQTKDKHLSNDAVRYWLQNQQANFPVTQSNPQTSNGISSTFAMPTTTPRTTIANTNGLGSSSVERGTLFWDTYKLHAFQHMQQQLSQVPSADKPILYQQLTKDAPREAAEAVVDQRQNAENLSVTDESANKAINNNVNKTSRSRSVLDNLLCSNNSIVTTNKRDAKDGEVLTKSEALMHGEKFLKWMETSSDPSVTATQILQFRTLLNNIMSGTTTTNKTKVKRK